MADKSNIEWTEATWNPIVGCSIVSPGCSNCYAMKMARRIEAMQPGSHYAGTTQVVNGNAVWTGKVALAPEHILTQPLRWCRPRKIFVNSMGDLFHESVPDEWIDRVFAVMALAPQHTFQVLTKRSARMRAYCSEVRETWCRSGSPISGSDRIHEAALSITGKEWLEATPGQWPLPNVKLGVSAEDQRRADERVPDLLETPAAVRFVSAEPLLGPINFARISPRTFAAYANSLTGVWQWGGGPSRVETPGLDWIIGGGESGPSARPMHPDWVRAIRDQCAAADVPFFFKQWGEWAPPSVLTYDTLTNCRLQARAEANPSLVHVFPDGLNMGRIGKRAAGRLLDGIEHNAMPEARR
ncbi:phage Gp37/Gp68 family protein [Azorhizobium sp. AG788]|uniref:DUF5131 family protein n=1 Tax=Azorhizobium sp. AG788 TaxID=2183897 RepID=UPI003139ACBE